VTNIPFVEYRVTFRQFLAQKTKRLFMETHVDHRTRIHKMHVKVNSGANSHLNQKATMTTWMHESPSKSPWKQWCSVETIQQFMHYQHQPMQHSTPFLEFELFHQLQCSPHLQKLHHCLSHHSRNFALWVIEDDVLTWWANPALPI